MLRAGSGEAMRYLVQLLIPALIFVGVVYVLTRQRGQGRSQRDEQSPHSGSDTAAFIAIVALGAVVALGTAWAMISLLE